MQTHGLASRIKGKHIHEYFQRKAHTNSFMSGIPTL